MHTHPILTLHVRLVHRIAIVFHWRRWRQKVAILHSWVSSHLISKVAGRLQPAIVKSQILVLWRILVKPSWRLRPLSICIRDFWRVSPLSRIVKFYRLRQNVLPLHFCDRRLCLLLHAKSQKSVALRDSSDWVTYDFCLKDRRETLVEMGH